MSVFRHVRKWHKSLKIGDSSKILMLSLKKENVHQNC
jgi:sRNA-binding carbon storage regulator CsrA